MKQITLGELIVKLHHDFGPEVMMQDYKAIAYAGNPDELCLMPKGRQITVGDFAAYLQYNVLYNKFEAYRDDEPCRFMSHDTPVWVDTHEKNYNNIAVVGLIYDGTVDLKTEKMSKD